MAFQKITESTSLYHLLDKMSTLEVLTHINTEDAKVAAAVQKAIPSIELLVDAIVVKMQLGGRLFYIGAGTSGRLGILDASECPPTFGVAVDTVCGIIAGGEKAISGAVEFAEDDTTEGWKALQLHQVNPLDLVIGISASGTAPYVFSALQACAAEGITTACICCNSESTLSKIVDHAIEVVVGPEFITGSTRMKSGTAQKMVLNMISTTVMIRMGRVEDNQMVHLQLSNQKLIDRGIKMVMKALKMEDYDGAKALLLQFGSVKKVLQHHLK